MFYFTRLLALAIIFTGSLVVGCGDDDGPGGCGDNFFWANELTNEYQAITDAALAYGMNQTPENCEALKQAYRDWLDAAEDLENCVPNQDRDEWLDAIADAEMEIETIC